MMVHIHSREDFYDTVGNNWASDARVHIEANSTAGCCVVMKESRCSFEVTRWGRLELSGSEVTF